MMKEDILEDNVVDEGESDCDTCLDILLWFL